jgi:hypothetical protein
LHKSFGKASLVAFFPPASCTLRFVSLKPDAGLQNCDPCAVSAMLAPKSSFCRLGIWATMVSIALRVPGSAARTGNACRASSPSASSPDRHQIQRQEPGESPKSNPVTSDYGCHSGYSSSAESSIVSVSAQRLHRGQLNRILWLAHLFEGRPKRDERKLNF